MGSGSAHVVARALMVDARTAETVSALRSAGIEPVLLKGPALDRWLYAPRGRARGYADADLLVGPDRLDAARAVLRSLGYEQFCNPPQTGPVHAEPWLRAGDEVSIDLHWNLSGAGAGPATAWRVLSRDLDRLAVNGVDVRVLRPPALAAVAAMHAGQHGTGKPLADLAIAVDDAGDDVWRAAARIAEELDASWAMAAGLRLLPEGEALADRLGLPSAALLRASGASRNGRKDAPLAMGIERLRRTPGVRARAMLLWREVVPTADELRWRSQFARRGPVALGLVRAGHPLWLLRHLPRSLRAWRRANAGGSAS